MSGAVGSAPNLMRRGLPVFGDFSSFAFKSASRMISTVPLRRYESCSSMVIDVQYASACLNDVRYASACRNLFDTNRQAKAYRTFVRVAHLSNRTLCSLFITRQRT